MNFSILCLILLAGLTSQGSLAKLKHHDGSEYQPLRARLSKDELTIFRESAEKLRNEEMIKLHTFFVKVRDKGHYLTTKFLEVLVNATRDVTEELMTNLTKIEVDSKAKMNQNSKSTSSFFNILISSVKDKYIKELIGEAKHLDGSLEAKAASLRQSIDQKINEINGQLRKAVQDAYESEAADYWHKIKETQMSKIISEARKGVEAQVSAFMTQQFTDNLQNYEAQLKRLQQSYVDETNRKIGDFEAKKNLYAQELKDLAASLKLSLEATNN